MEIHLEGRLPKSPAAAIHLAGRSCNHLRRVRLRRDPTDMITTRRTVSEKIALQLLGYDFGVDRQVSEPLKDSDGRRADHLIHQGPRRGLLDTPGLIGSAALSRYLLRERVKILILCGNDIVLLAQVRGRQLDKLRRGFHT